MNDVSDTANLQAEAEAAQARDRRLAARRTWLVRLAVAVAVIGICWTAWYLLFGRNHISTDNAYVNAEMAQVTPQIAAPVAEVLVRDTQSVKKGDILVRLDPTDARIAVAMAEAGLADVRRRFRQAVATNGALSAQVQTRSAAIAAAQAQLGAAQADVEKARIDLHRREILAPDGAVSGEELTNARRNMAAARAALAAAQAGVSQADAGRTAAQGELAANDALVSGTSEGSNAGVLTALARLDAARIDLERMTIRAPIDGTITRRQVQIGQRVAQGQPIMAIVPLQQVYVDANFKERQLRRVREGMPATVTADIYGSSVTYHGKVAGIAGGTGASMAIIPAQNATGNWIKVVQRLPVRIALDPKELLEHPLRVGLSAEVEIDLSSN